MVGVLRAGVVIAAVASLSACIDASRVNSTCRWIDTRTGRLDLSRAGDREHLRQDTQVAWEIGQRYADVRYRTNPMLARPLLDACRRTMDDSIIARHAVTLGDIDHATAARAWWADIMLIFLPMLVATAVMTDAATREITRSLEKGNVRIVALLVLASLVALVGTGMTQMWAMTVETWRLRDGHIAGRAFVLPSVSHPGITFATLWLVTALVTARRASRAPRSVGAP
jgi:hypothetical protein